MEQLRQSEWNDNLSDFNDNNSTRSWNSEYTVANSYASDRTDVSRDMSLGNAEWSDDGGQLLGERRGTPARSPTPPILSAGSSNTSQPRFVFSSRIVDGDVEVNIREDSNATRNSRSSYNSGSETNSFIMQSGGYIDSSPANSDNNDIRDWDDNSNHSEGRNDGRSSPFERPASPEPPYNTRDDLFGLTTDAQDFLTHSSPGTPSHYPPSPQSAVDQNLYSSQGSPNYGTAPESPSSPHYSSRYDTPAPYNNLDTSVNSTSPDHISPSDQDDFQGFSSSDNVSDQSDEGADQAELSLSTNDESSNHNTPHILNMSPGFSEFDEASSPTHGNNSNHSSRSDLSGALDNEHRAPSVEIISDDDNTDTFQAQAPSYSSAFSGQDQGLEIGSSYPPSMYMRRQVPNAGIARRLTMLQQDYISATRAEMNALYSTHRDNINPEGCPPARSWSGTPISTATESPVQEDLEVLLDVDEGKSQTASTTEAERRDRASSALSDVDQGASSGSANLLMPGLSPEQLELLEESHELRMGSRRKDVRKYIQGLRKRSQVQNEYLKALERDQEKRRQELERQLSEAALAMSSAAMKQPGSRLSRGSQNRQDPMKNDPTDTNTSQVDLSERKSKRKSSDTRENTTKPDEKRLKLEKDVSGRSTPAGVASSSTMSPQVKRSRSLPSATFIPSRDSSPAKRSKLNASASSSTKVEPGETKCTWDKKKLNLSINLAINLDKAKKKRESPTGQTSGESSQARDIDAQPSTSGDTSSSKKTEKSDKTRKTSTYVPTSGQINEAPFKAVANSNVTRAKADSSSRVGSLERRDNSSSGVSKRQAGQPENVVSIQDLYPDSDSENDVNWEPLGNESTDVSISSSEDLAEPDEGYKVRVPISAAALLEKYQDIDDEDDDWTPS